MAATSTVGQASGHTHSSTATTMKYRTTNSGTPLAHLDVDNNFELLRQAVNGIIGDIDGVVDRDLTSDLSNASLGYTESGKNYPVEKSSNKLYVNVPWTDTTYSTATSNNLGLVKIGYSESGKNYPVELSNEQMYVNVPWSNTTYSVATASTPGLVKSGGDITVAADGTVTVNGSGVATASTPGLVKSGGDITVAADGTVSVTGGASGAINFHPTNSPIVGKTGAPAVGNGEFRTLAQMSSDYGMTIPSSASALLCYLYKQPGSTEWTDSSIRIYDPDNAATSAYLYWDDGTSSQNRPAHPKQRQVFIPIQNKTSTAATSVIPNSATGKGVCIYWSNLSLYFQGYI